MIKEAWDEFDMQVLPLDCGEVQRVETKRAFYQGSVAMFCGMVKMFNQVGEVTDDDLKKFDVIQAEVDQFVADLKDGKV